MQEITQSRVGVSVIIPTRNRASVLCHSLERIMNCNPRPSEILVYIDNASDDSCAVLPRRFDTVRLLTGAMRVGPGGARNSLIRHARNEVVSSFDDDSFPLDVDYFQRVQQVMTEFPTAAIVASVVYHRDENMETPDRETFITSDFIGCGCVYRRSIFLATSGYVPLPTAYGMEEVDLALRLHAQGEVVVSSKRLRVFHDTDLDRHADRQVTIASIANLALLTYLRYPLVLWPVGVGQILRRIVWLLRHARYAGVLRGIANIPAQCYRYRQFRQTLSVSAVRSYLALRRSRSTIDLARDSSKK
jgi:GT2 family glycosyltransferase